jgi:hypothetical protein
VRAASHRTPLPSDGSARHPPARQARAPATAQAALMAGVPVEAPKRIALGLRGQTVRRLRANTGPLACTGRETETAGRGRLMGRHRQSSQTEINVGPSAGSPGSLPSGLPVEQRPEFDVGELRP